MSKLKFLPSVVHHKEIRLLYFYITITMQAVLELSPHTCCIIQKWLYNTIL